MPQVPKCSSILQVAKCLKYPSAQVTSKCPSSLQVSKWFSIYQVPLRCPTALNCLNCLQYPSAQVPQVTKFPNYSKHPILPQVLLKRKSFKCLKFPIFVSVQAPFKYPYGLSTPSTLSVQVP